MLRSSLVLIGFLASSAAYAQDNRWNPDDRIINALNAQVTKKGLDAIGSSVGPLVGDLLGEGGFAIDDIEQNIPVLGNFVLKNVEVGIAMKSFDIQPKDSSVGAKIGLEIVLDVALNSAANPYQISIPLLCSSLGNGHMVLKNVRVATKAGRSIDLVFTGNLPNKQLDLSIDTSDLDMTIGSIDASGHCEGTLEFAGTALKEVLIERVVKPQIQTLFDDLGDALAGAAFVDSVDVLGKQLYVEIVPNQIRSSVDGLQLEYTSKVTAAQDPCVADIDPLGFLRTNGQVPTLSESKNSQVAAYLADDVLNQALYAAFSGGLLCLDVDAELVGDNLPAGLALDSSLLPLLAGDGFKAILPEKSEPLLIRTQPSVVPVAYFDGPAPITIDVQDLGVGFFTTIENRMARVVGVDVSVNVGADVAFDASTGELGILLSGLSAQDFVIVASGDEFVPGTNAVLGEKITGLLDTVLGLALGGVLDSLSFTLPAFGGLGLQDLVLGPAPTASDWLRIDAAVGTVSYGAEGGCSGDGGGCGGGCDSSCDGGCTTGNLGMVGWFGVFLPVWVARRRRR